MPKDLRTWLKNLEERVPGEPLRVSKLVKPASFEVSSILDQLEKRGNLSAVLFNQVASVKGEVKDYRLLCHAFTTREKMAVSLDINDSSRVALFEKYLESSRQKRKIEKITPAEAPVKEVIRKEDSLDLADLPIMKHNFMDGGPYLTPVVVARDPRGERYNTSWNRMMYIDSHHLAVYMSPRHLWAYFQDMEAKGESMPVGIVLGHHLAFMLSASALVPLDEDEYEVAGGLLGESLRVVPSETYGDRLLVPADAEIVIEGEILPQKRTIEGPFGEFAGLIGPQRLSWLFRARAITHRRHPIMHSVFGAHLDHLYAHFAIEASIFQRVKQAVSGVKDICWLGSGGPFHLVISLKKRTEGEPMRAAMAALSASNFIKHVFVVDDDIDPGNAEEVMWAIATCCQADSAITILNNIQGQLLDPSLRQETKGSGLVIDATRPLDRPYPPRAVVPPEAQKLRLEDYIDF
ncbi:MAG: UbiD family decarboxylase [Deltaproteobacteria bacterium]|nr:UbiD family decarboxylase [Deltaproteobacteria bacterium]